MSKKIEYTPKLNSKQKQAVIDYYQHNPSKLLDDWEKYVNQFTGEYKAKLENNEKNFWHYVADHKHRAIVAGKYKEDV